MNESKEHISKLLEKQLFQPLIDRSVGAAHRFSFPPACGSFGTFRKFQQRPAAGHPGPGKKGLLPEHWYRVHAHGRDR